jgi:hypothetical protein
MLAGAPQDQGTIKVTFFSNTSLNIIAHGNHLFQNMSTKVGQTSYRIWYSGSAGSAVEAGAFATLHPRLGIANGTGIGAGLTYLITNCSSVTTTDLTVYGGATESIVEGGGEGNHTYLRVRVVRDPNQKPIRLLAANADGFHSSCVRTGPKLLDSEFAYTGDDLLNIHSRESIVLRPLSATAAYIIDTLGSSSPADYDASTLMLEQARIGDTIAFWELGTLAPNGSATVTALARVRGNAEIETAAKQALSEINAPPYSQRIGHPFGTRVWLVNWSAPAGPVPFTVPKFALVDIPRLRSHGAVVAGNYFHDAYMRLGLYDSPGSVVENNTFARAFPLYVGETGDNWLEGPPLVSNVVIRGNTFSDIYGRYPIVAQPGTTSGVVVKDNSCEDAAGLVVPCIDSL